MRTSRVGMRHQRLGLLGALLAFGSLLAWWPETATAVEQRVKLELEVGAQGAPRGGLVPLDVIAHIERGWHINAHEPKQPYLIPTELKLELPENVQHEPVEYPPPEKRKFAFSGDEELLVYEGKLGLATAIRVPADYPRNELRIAATLRYQACNDTTCLPPTTAAAEKVLRVVDAGIGERAGEIYDAPAAMVAGGASRFEVWLSERGIFFTVLAVALLGLGLNLTPCVYPLISITVAYFGRQSHSRGHVLLLAALYVLGIAVSFSALGVAAALSGGLFGRALQSPLVLGSIAATLVALALSSFGLYQIQPPAVLMRWAGGAAGGSVGALFMGLTMGIVAAPCVGPIVVGLLVFVGSRQDAQLGFLLFFALALGMGLPYLGLAVAARSIQHLPRSGEWLLWTERFFGCVLLAMAAYFVALLLPDPWRSLLLPAVIGASGIYLGFVASAGGSLRYFPLVKRAVGVVMVGVALWLAQPQAGGQPIGWEPLEALADDGPGAEGAKPVLIDFAAEWCIPCREMDHTTYVHPDVVREAERFRMVKADVTEENDETSRVVKRYDVRGVPTVILFSSKGEERQRLVGYVSPEEMLEAMKVVR